MSDAEWLERAEPTRVAVDEFQFRLKATKTELRQMNADTHGGDCLANQIASGESISSGSTSYGGERINEDGTAERLVGCRVCGAMCTITYSTDLHSAVVEDKPYDAINVAEAPQPNPWMELGTFDDCKAGKVEVPADASALTEPVNLNQEQRQIVKIFSGAAD
ncbi:MAG: hypothetical protein AAB462_03825 [Patescibacteria group bacterium]